MDKRIDGAAEVGVHKTSMLQDLERGRPMEIDALLGAVVELGEVVGQPMPTCRTVLALVRERGAAGRLLSVDHDRGSNCSASVAQYEAPIGRISSLKSYRGWCNSASSLAARPPPSMM